VLKLMHFIRSYFIRSSQMTAGRPWNEDFIVGKEDGVHPGFYSINVVRFFPGTRQPERESSTVPPAYSLHDA
jgi:hypothetical protein